MKQEIKKVSIVGMGALGLLYGNHIAEHMGPDALTFVMDSARVEKYKDAQFEINGKKASFRVTSFAEAEPADLLIVAVKYTGLEGAMEEMKRCIGRTPL